MIRTGEDPAEIKTMLVRTGATGTTCHDEYVPDPDIIRALLSAGKVEIVGRDSAGGILVSAGDVNASAHPLISLFDKPALGAELGRAARGRAERPFSVEAVGGQLGTMLNLQPSPGATR